MASNFVPWLVATLLVASVSTQQQQQQCTADRTSFVEFSVLSKSNATGRRIVSANIAGYEQERDSVGMYVTSWTSTCDSLEKVHLQIVSDVPVVTSNQEVQCVPARGLTCRQGYQLLPNIGCYKHVKALTTWEDARINCAAEGSILAVPNSQQELQFMVSMHTSPGEGPWFGIRKYGSHWKTLDGQILGSSGYLPPWSPGEPNGDGDCVLIWKGELGDNPCERKMESICKQL